MLGDTCSLRLRRGKKAGNTRSKQTKEGGKKHLLDVDGDDSFRGRSRCSGMVRLY